MRVSRLDHFVLTVANIDTTVEFYTEVLGMSRVTFGEGRVGLRFGDSKINLHLAGHEFEPKAATPTPGSADVCLVVDDDLDSVREQLAAKGIPVELGPVPRAGAVGQLQSLYVRDPDGNLVELSNYV